MKQILPVISYWTTCLLISLGMGLYLPLQGQQVMTNSQGERILVFPDGSWRPVVPADSVYMRAPDDPANMPVPGPGQPSETTEGRSDLLRQWRSLSTLINAREKSVQTRFRHATNAQFKAGQSWENAKANEGMLSPDQLAAFKTTYEASIGELARVKKEMAAIEKLAGRMRQQTYPTSAITTRMYDRLRNDYVSYLERFAPGSDNPPLLQPSPVAGPVPAGELQTSSATETAPPTSSPTPLQTGPVSQAWTTSASHTPECRFIRNEADPATGLQVRELAYEPILFHTDPELRSFFKNKDLITCRGRLSRSGPYVFLHLEFEIASANSQSNFGGIAQGALLRLKMMNGQLLSLYNQQEDDRGRIDTYSGHTLYTARYPLGKDELRQLETGELDKMRVLWSTGYEDYDVVFLDVLRRQLACLMEGR